MPSPFTTDVSVTVRFGVPIVPILPLSTLALILDKRSKYYCIGYEQNEGIESGHWQCAVRLSDSTQTKTTKDWLIREIKTAVKPYFEWQPKNDKRTVKVKKAPDLEQLAGGYCSKQDFNPVIKGFDRDELLKGKERYVVNCEGKTKKVPISKAGLVPKFREYLSKVEERTTVSPDREHKWNCLTSREKYDFIARLIITDGFDLSTISFLQKNDLIKNWLDYFENFKNPKNILDEFFE